MCIPHTVVTSQSLSPIACQVAFFLVARTVIVMSKCRATSFYLAPGKLLYFQDHAVAARIDQASADGRDKWFLVPITNRRDVATIRALYPKWNGVIAHVPVKRLKGLAFSNTINQNVAGWEHTALASAALEYPQIVNINVTSERTIEGRRPYKSGDATGRITYLITCWNREFLDAARTTNGKTPLETLGGAANFVAELFPSDARRDKHGKGLGKKRKQKLTDLVKKGYVAQVASAAILVSNGLIDPYTDEGKQILDKFLQVQSVPLPVSLPQVLTEGLKDLVERSRIAGIEVDLVKVFEEAIRPERVLWPEGAQLIAGSRAASKEMRDAIRALVTQNPVPEDYALWAAPIREALDAGEQADPITAPRYTAPRYTDEFATTASHEDWLTQWRRDSHSRVQDVFDSMVEVKAEALHGKTSSFAELPVEERNAISLSVAKKMLVNGGNEYLEFLAELENVDGFDEIGRVARVLCGDMFPHPAEQALIEHMLTVDVLNATQKPRSDHRTFAEIDKEETALVAKIQSLAAATDTDGLLLQASMVNLSTTPAVAVLEKLARKFPTAREMYTSGGQIAVQNYAREQVARSNVSGSVGVDGAWFTDLDRLRESKPRLCATQDTLAKFGETRVRSAVELSPAQAALSQKLHDAAETRQSDDVNGEPIDFKVITTRAALKTNATEMRNCTFRTYGSKVFSDRTDLILRVECTAALTKGRRLFNVGLRRTREGAVPWEISQVNTVGNGGLDPDEQRFVEKYIRELLRHNTHSLDPVLYAQSNVPLVALPTRSERQQTVTLAPEPQQTVTIAPEPQQTVTIAPDTPVGNWARIRRLVLPGRTGLAPVNRPT